MNRDTKKMRAAVIKAYDQNNQLEIIEADIPTIGENDVLISVKAASINPLDTRIRTGKLKLVLKFKLPLTLGNDLAGVVSEVGARVTKFKVGDEVYARCDTLRIGSFAEYAVVSEENVALKPKNLTMLESASLPLVGLTVWQILVERAKIQKGQKVLIHGGAGGVGSIGIQLAKQLGTYVATTVSSTDFDTVKRYGADEAIDYRTQDFSTICKDYDLVLDTRGGDTLEKSFYVLKQGGRVISVNGTPDANMADDLGLNPVMKLIFTLFSLKNNMKAKKLGVGYDFHFMRPSGTQLDELRNYVEANKIKPVVDKVFSLQDIKQAFDYSESGKAKGKVVISI